MNSEILVKLLLIGSGFIGGIFFGAVIGYSIFDSMGRRTLRERLESDEGGSRDINKFSECKLLSE